MTTPQLAEVAVGDQRLDARLVATAIRLAAYPSAPINVAHASWQESKAAYRLFQNAKVTPAKVLAPHQAHTYHRLREHPVVLAIQDSTYLNYTAHRQTRGLGPIGHDTQTLRGLVLHSTLAVTPTGLPLGLLDQQLWARPATEARLSKTARRRRPLKEQESFKWLKALRASLPHVPPATQVVTVTDQEGDLYDLLAEAERLESSLLVRAYHNRALLDPAEAKLWDTVATQPVAGTLTVPVAATKKQPARTATVTVRYQTVTLRPPRDHPRVDATHLPPLTLSAIWVQESAPPEGVEPLDWKLLTNVPVATWDDACERIGWYRQRYQIEGFHKVLKSGCTVEQCRLQSGERLARYVTLMSIIAWRLFWLTHINRHAPDASCGLILTEPEWQALYVTIHRTTELPPQPPSVRQAVRWIAQLGGFLGRTGDREPGITAIWRGWQRLQDRADTWSLSHPTPIYG